jgi:predicted DNA-binding transcriptional regulator AlpA
MNLIDTAGIAQILGVSRAHVTDRLTKQHDFPKPFINRSQKLRRWKQDDVFMWATKGSK